MTRCAKLIQQTIGQRVNGCAWCFVAGAIPVKRGCSWCGWLVDQCSENWGEAWMVVYEAVRVDYSSCVSVGVCAFVCVCVYQLCVGRLFILVRSSVCLCGWRLRRWLSYFVGISCWYPCVYPCGCQSVYHASGCVCVSKCIFVCLVTVCRCRVIAFIFNLHEAEMRVDMEHIESLYRIYNRHSSLH